MTLRMGDAVTVSNLPPGLDAYAGYIDGRYANIGAIASQHPGAYILPITVWLANEGTAIDIEPSDANPPDAPAFVNLRIAAGVSRPVLYSSISEMPAVVAALNASKLPRYTYRLWSAHYDVGSHICGPTTCRYQGDATPACDGTQWIDHNNAWDESLLSDSFFVPVKPPTIIDTTTSDFLVLGGSK